MQQRLRNPVTTVPNALQHLLALGDTLKKGVPLRTLTMVHLRASQINGCGFCVDMHSRELKQDGETDERIWAVAAWRESPLFTDQERAALALAEYATRMADRSDAVPDEVWNEAAKLYDEKALGVLVMNIAMINFWNRINVTIRQTAGAKS